MKNKIKLLLILLSIISCSSKISNLKTIEYVNNYKFNSEIENDLKIDTEDWKHQISAHGYSTKGDHQNALENWDLAFRTVSDNYTTKHIDSINNKYNVVPAIDYIIEQAKVNQVIIINEAHHNSSHRIFTKSLLQKLYDNGYRNLGLEALKTIDTLLHVRKYPIRETGDYIDNPQFGNLVRDALAIGYKLFGYESKDKGSGKLREIAQAKNIQKVIEKRPNEKFLIHCGFDHVLEGKYDYWEKTMAGRLSEYTGIDPFTINQTKYSERSNPMFNDPMLKALNIVEPSILLDRNNFPFRYESEECWTDVAVFHPNTEYINDRPNWLFKNGNQNVLIELKEIDILFPVMIFAFRKGENINNAIPIDIYEVRDKNILPYLALAKGEYEIVVVNREKDARKFELKVK